MRGKQRGQQAVYPPTRTPIGRSWNAPRLLECMTQPVPLTVLWLCAPLLYSVPVHACSCERRKRSSRSFLWEQDYCPSGETLYRRKRGHDGVGKHAQSPPAQLVLVSRPVRGEAFRHDKMSKRRSCSLGPRRTVTAAGAYAALACKNHNQSCVGSSVESAHIYTFRGFFRGCRRMLFDCCGRASSPRDDQCRHLMKAPNGL